MARAHHSEERSPHFSGWREKVHDIIFEADTRLGKLFDVSLLVLIAISVLVVMLESVSSIAIKYEYELRVAEWIITGLFTVEYFLRLYTVYKPRAYATSFFGVVDLLSILPTYASLLFPGYQYLLAVRALRLIRVFRIFKMVRYVRGSQEILLALKNSWPKITVFLFFILTLTTIMGSVMYVVEGGAEEGNPAFTSIPKSIYWAIITLTTVGYGDIVPYTIFGQAISAAIMVMGYSIIAVPTGITTVEYAKVAGKSKVSTQHCHNCSKEGHDSDAKHCKFCGEIL